MPASAEVESVLLFMVFYLWLESVAAIGRCLWMEVTFMENSDTAKLFIGAVRVNFKLLTELHYSR
jgi:hypothetical protein